MHAIMIHDPCATIDNTLHHTTPHLVRAKNE